MRYVLDPEVAQLLEQINRANLPELHTLPVSAARAQMRAARAVLAGKPAPVHSVVNLTLPSPGGALPVRIYQPDVTTTAKPALVYFHGGGWVICDLDTHDDICRALCHHAGCVVVSVDYRLAPEHKFPAAVDDALAATCWVADHAAELHADPQRVAVGGDSAGGNLAAVVAQLARDHGGPTLKFQLLIYPATDMTLMQPSVTEFAEGYRLTRSAMEWFIAHYLRDKPDQTDPRASPLLARDLKNLPRALVITAGFDPLLDEGRAYADKLKQAGVPVEYRCDEGMIHGYFGMAGVLGQARAVQVYAGRALRSALTL